VKALIKKECITDEFMDEIFELVQDNQMEEGTINTSTKIKGSLWLREAFLKAQAYVTQRMSWKQFIFKVALGYTVFKRSSESIRAVIASRLNKGPDPVEEEMTFRGKAFGLYFSTHSYLIFFNLCLMVLCLT
jgi:hypothetical protein